MARIINPAVQITGLSDSGTTDTAGTWNAAVDVTTYGVPSTASAVLLMLDMPSSAKWWGFRDPDSVTSKAGFYSDCAASSDSTVIVPCRNGTVDLYREASGPTFWVAGYWEAGAVEWLTAGNELTRQTTSATNFTWDFTSDDPDATGVIICQSSDRSEDSPSLKVSSDGTPTAWSNTIRWNANQISDAGIFILPLDSGQACYVDTGSAGTVTYNIVGLIKQPISFLYDDNSGPTESPGTTGSWTAGTYDYGTKAGIGCIIQTYGLTTGYIAAADTSNPFAGGSGALSQMTALMHTVKSDGTWNYILETGTPTFQIYWFMSAWPEITNVDTDDVVGAAQSTWTINGTGFGTD